jgi:hypothetical protein
MQINFKKPALKPLLGIRLFGWGLIVTSLFHMGKLITDHGDYMRYYSYLAGFAYVRYAFSWFQRIVGISVGIGLLFEKKWSRTIGLCLGAFTVLTVYWKHPYPAFLEHTRYLDKVYGSLLRQWNVPSSLTFESVTVAGVIAHCVLDVLFWLAFYYYMTRPGVRSRFTEIR